jgi:hypothetical protein
MATLADALRQTGYVQDNQPIPQPSTGMAEMLRQHIASIPQKFEENQRNQMEALQRAFPDNTLANADPHAMAEYAMQVPLTGMVAYHGTPHNILGKFDISKVGTGEGAQAYGHGMYFAENPKVAEQYQTMAAKVEPEALKYKNREIQDLYNNAERAQQSAYRLPNGPAKNAAIEKANAELSVWEDVMLGQHPQVLKMNAENPNPDDVWKEKQDFLRNLDLTKFKGLDENIGNLYKVDIPDEYIPKMVQWETPLSDMDEKLASVINPLQESLKNQPNPSLFKNLKSVGDVIQYANAVGLKPHLPLQEAGYKGIRYLDEGSRSAGKGTSNFVVFDPSEVKILEKNGQPSRKELIEEQVNKLKD